jgi:hypothetical protein
MSGKMSEHDSQDYRMGRKKTKELMREDGRLNEVIRENLKKLEIKA